MDQDANDAILARLQTNSLTEQADRTPEVRMMRPDDGSATPRIVISLYRGRVRFVMNRAMRDLARTRANDGTASIAVIT
jgi:hypothetical protein